MVEPEKLLYIDVPNVTHEVWKDMCEEKKIQLIEKTLTDKIEEYATNGRIISGGQ